MATPAQKRDAIIRTVLGEAADQGQAGMNAVASVIKNRAASGQFGSSDPYDIALAHNANGVYQFSANAAPGANGGNNVGRNADPNSAAYQQAAAAVDGVLGGTIADPTGGATYYHTGAVHPGWDRNMTTTAQIGAHTFYAPPGTALAYAPTPESAALAAIGAATGQTPPLPPERPGPPPPLPPERPSIHIDTNFAGNNAGDSLAVAPPRSWFPMTTPQMDAGINPATGLTQLFNTYHAPANTSGGPDDRQMPQLPFAPNFSAAATGDTEPYSPPAVSTHAPGQVGETVAPRSTNAPGQVGSPVPGIPDPYKPSNGPFSAFGGATGSGSGGGSARGTASLAPDNVPSGPISSPGIAGTVQLPAGARPTSVPTVPKNSSGSPDDRDSGFAPISTPAPSIPLPPPRPIDATSLTDALYGNNPPSYQSAGTLPDPTSRPDAPFTTTFGPKPTVDHPGTILGGASQHIDPSTLQPLANGLSAISSWLAPAAHAASPPAATDPFTGSSASGSARSSNSQPATGNVGSSYDSNYGAPGYSNNDLPFNYSSGNGGQHIVQPKPDVSSADLFNYTTPTPAYTTKLVANPAYLAWANGQRETSPFTNPGVQGLSPDDRQALNDARTAAAAKPAPAKQIVVRVATPAYQPQKAIVPPAPVAPTPIQVSNGYTYLPDGKGGYVKAGIAPQYAGLTPSQMYDAANNGGVVQPSYNASAHAQMSPGGSLSSPG